MSIRKKNSSRDAAVSRNPVLEYTPPQLHKSNSCWYIDFKAFDPLTGVLKRKKYLLNFIKEKKDRNVYAREMISELHEKLRRGWSPWIEQRSSKQMYLWDDVCERYLHYITRLLQDEGIREETFSGYVSFISNIRKYNLKRSRPIAYIYQFDRSFIIDLLNYIYVDLERAPQTRDNYLTFCRVFSSYLVQNDYVSIAPSEGIMAFGKRMRKKKNRDIIPEEQIKLLTEYLDQHNRHFLLASYLLFYCFIRPKEMAKLRIEHVSLKRSLIHIPAEFSKNKKDGFVSLPTKVIHLMLELRIFDAPGNYYLFSDKLKPGREWRDEKQFRDFWNHHVRKTLKWPIEYKFYSLKDTGITSMLRCNYDVLTVRDQARHSSILMTDIYTPHDIQKANELIVRHDGAL